MAVVDWEDGVTPRKLTAEELEDLETLAWNYAVAHDDRHGRSAEEEPVAMAELVEFVESLMLQRWEP